MERKLGVLALDQSTVCVGHSTFVNGVLESWGQFKPDWPKLDFVRKFVRDYCEQFRVEGLEPVIVCESIYFGRNVVTFKQLAILMGHIQAATYDCGARFEVVTANDALFALTGIRTSPKNPVKREVRKALIIEAASKLAKTPLREDEADSVAVGVCFLKSLVTIP